MAKHRRRIAKRFCNVHHITPRSRCREFGVRPNNKNNLVIVNRLEHELYHQLFGNMVPQEACQYLCDTFWLGVITMEDCDENNI